MLWAVQLNLEQFLQYAGYWLRLGVPVLTLYLQQIELLALLKINKCR